ncbi:universal stress protein [Mycobacterium sp. SMC-4]|uniref:universal stress protein n=1 Tax=Mycobacterium sp. SMC-4 TaxID=2857059 RepID=UPI003CFDE1E0
MDTSSLAIAFVAVWLITGAVTGLWLVRRGHDVRWIPISLMLGPIFVPIALERVDRGGPRPATTGDRGDSTPPSGAPRILVGLDGSAQSSAAFDAAKRLFGATGQFVVTEVVAYEAAEDPDQVAVTTARERLTAATADGAAVRREVLVGAPAEALSHFAEQIDADVIVVGRRGRGLTRRLLGSVSSSLLEQAEVPVLVVDAAVRA